MLVGCCLEVDIRIRRYTNKRGIEQNTHPWLQINFGFWHFIVYVKNVDYSYNLFWFETWLYSCYIYSHIYFIVKFIWFECKLYDENYVHMKRHRDISTYSNWKRCWCVLYGTSRKTNIVICYLMYLECYFCYDIILFLFMLILIFSF